MTNEDYEFEKLLKNQQDAEPQVVCFACGELLDNPDEPCPDCKEEQF